MFPQKHKTTIIGLFIARLHYFIVLAAFCVFGFATFLSNGSTQKAYAATSSNLNFQARLYGSSGNVVPDGYYNVEFKLYSASSGGSALWTETYYDSNGVTAGNDNRLRLVNGYFSANLGSLTAFGALNWDQEMWLTMNVGGSTQTATPTYDGEMTPRVKLTAVPYAFRAGAVTDSSGNAYTADDLVKLAPSSVQGVNSANTAIRVNQTGAGNLLQLQSSSTDRYVIENDGDVVSSGDGTFQGGDLTVGSASVAGDLTLYDGSSNTGTLAVAALGQNTVYTLPDPGGATGTICLQEIANCAGSGDIVQDGNSFGEDIYIGSNDDYGLNFETNGTVKFSLSNTGAALFKNGVDSATAFQIQNAAGVDQFVLDSTSGALTIGSSTRTGTIAFGQSSSSNTINFGSAVGNGNTQTINIGASATGGSTTNVNIGSTIGGTVALQGTTTVTGRTTDTGSNTAFSVTNGGTGNIARFFDSGSANAVVGIADGGAATFRNQTDSTAAFNIQNAAGTNLLVADTTNLNVDITGNTTILRSSATNSEWSRISYGAGQISSSGQTGVNNVRAMATYNGSLYVATFKSNAIEIFRHDGGTSWTKVSQAAGTIAEDGGSNTSITGVYSMVVHNGSLYVGTYDAGGAEVYRYDGGTSWTLVTQSTPGTIASGGTSGIEGIYALTSYNGSLYIGTEKTNEAEIYRYDGGTTWTRVSYAAGQIVNGGVSGIDRGRTMTVVGSYLYLGTSTDTAQAQVYRYDGSTWTVVSQATAGTIAEDGGANTAIASVNASAVHNGSLYVATSETNETEVYRYDGGTSWTLVTQSTPGTIAASGTSAINAVFGLTSYNGYLYAGTSETDSAQVYRYNNTAGDWTLVSQSTAGTIASGGTTSIDAGYWLHVHNGSLYLGTNETSSGELYRYSDNLLEARSSTTNSAFSVGLSGNIAFQSSVNSEHAFSLQDANSNYYLNLNSADAILSLGDTGIASTIQVGNTTGAVTQTINIGNNSTAGSTTNVTVGSTIGGTTTLQSPTTTINSATAINLNSATIATNQASIGLFNTNATTATMLQAATSISVGATTGTFTVRNANQTFGNAAGAGVFTNNGATYNATLAVTDDVNGGTLGGGLAASASVDVYTSISIAQTTASQTITLPTPTASTSYGRILYISNVGTTSFTMLGTTVSPGSSITVLWSNTNGGASWQIVSNGSSANSILNQSSSDQTADFRISGTGQANTSVVSPLFDSISGGLSLGTSTATGVTIGGTTNTTSVLLQGAAAATYTIGTSNNTGGITLGNSTATNTISIGAAAGNGNTQTINVGTSATGGSTTNVNIGSTVAGTTTLQSPTTTISSATTNINSSTVINLNSATIATNQASIGIFNTTATTATMLQAATSISMGATTGTLTIRNANTTLGNAAGSGVFTNNGSTLNTTLALSNDADGGAIGTAATTVDIYTSISIAQTTASQTFTIPTPTASTSYGRLLYLGNIGSVAFTVGGVTMNPGTTATLVWSNTNGGASWQFAGADGNGILNQNASDQTANFRISGTGRANTSFTAPLFDSISGGLSLGTSTATGVTIGGTTNTTAVTLQGAAASTYTIGTSNNTGGITVGNSTASNTITIGASAGASNTQTINIGTSATASSTTNVTMGSTIGSSATTLQAGSGNINFNSSTVQFTEVTGTRTFGVQARTTNVAGTSLTIAAGAAGSGASAFGGGTLSLQGGAAAGTGNANGGNVILDGGSGVGSGVKGLVVVSNATFSAATVQNFTGSASITQANVDAYSTILISSNAAGYTATLGDPTITTAGRMIYVTNTGSYDMTLSVNGGGTGNTITLKPSTTATMVWNGSDWTAAGASSSTDLQAAYNNTATSAGGAELILNAPGGSADGLTIRNNGTTPISGGLLEVQTSIGSNLFTVNNNATEYANNGGAESSTFTMWTGAFAGGTVNRNTTAANVATGQASVSVATTGAGHGAENTLSTTLRANLTYSVSYTVKGATNFTTLETVYSRDGTNTSTTSCNSSQTVTTSIWSRISCTFTAPSSGITASNSIFIRQTDGTSRTFYIDNLSVTVDADVNHAADGSVDSALGSNWTQYDADGGAGTTTVTRDTSTIYDTSGSVSDVTTAHINEGVRNNLTITPEVSTQYLVTFYARSSNTFNDITVGFLPAGGNSAPVSAQLCTDYNTQSVSTSGWTRITCIVTTPSSGISDPDLVIYQPTATARTFYVDALSMTLNTNTASNVQIGGGNKGGPTTLFTLDRSNGAPIAANNDAYLGSMYYDTSTGRIQCYEADGWGACGAAPDNYVNLNPEYSGAVLNGSGVGTMTADLCSNDAALSVNSSLCSSGEAKNYYRWTSPQASQQTYSIYVSYQLPTTFNGFSSDDTVQLIARTDSTSNAAVTYEMYKSTGSAVTQCGSGETTVVTSANTWQSVGINGNESTGCSFTSSSAGNFVIFKINLKANSNANAYVSTLSFTTTGR